MAFNDQNTITSTLVDFVIRVFGHFMNKLAFNVYFPCELLKNSLSYLNRRKSKYKPQQSLCQNSSKIKNHNGSSSIRITAYESPFIVTPDTIKNGKLVMPSSFIQFYHYKWEIMHNNQFLRQKKNSVRLFSLMLVFSGKRKMLKMYFNG